MLLLQAHSEEPKVGFCSLGLGRGLGLGWRCCRGTWTSRRGGVDFAVRVWVGLRLLGRFCAWAHEKLS